MASTNHTVEHPHVQGEGPTAGSQEEDVDETPRSSSTQLTAARMEPQEFDFSERLVIPTKLSK